jgi:hypothetical protein
MNNKELKHTIAKMIDSGKPKQEIFQALIAKGENISTVANLLASHPSQHAYEQNHKKINILIAFMFIWALISAPNGYITGLKTSIEYGWTLAFLSFLVPLLYAYGFYKNYAKAYNIFITIGLISIFFGFAKLFKLPNADTYISLCFNTLLLVYAWYLRTQLFPDFFILSPKKVNGQYAFTS